MRQEETDDRKARLFGGLAGLGVGGISQRAGGAARETLTEPLNRISSLSQSLFQEEQLGQLLKDADPSFWKKVSQIAKDMGIEEFRAITGPSDFAVKIPRVAEKYPFLFREYDKVDNNLISLIGPNVDTAAHELSHISPSKAQSIISSLLAVFNKPVVRGIALGGGVGMGMSDNPTTQAFAPAISVMPYIPELVDEAKANIQGLRYTNKLEGTLSALKSAPGVISSFLTYLIPAAATALAPMLAGLVYRHMNQEKKASEGATGRLKNTARRAWASEGPKPKTTQPNKVNPEIPVAKPPSKREYYKDIQESFQNPSRGWRYA